MYQDDPVLVRFYRVTQDHKSVLLSFSKKQTGLS